MSRSLTAFIPRIPEYKAGIHACQCPAAFYATLNVLSRLALDQWQFDKGRFISGDGTIRVFPAQTKQQYYQDIMAAAQDGDVAFVPEYMAEAFRAKGATVRKDTTHYVLDPQRLATLPGGSLKRLRNATRRASEVVTVTHPTELPVADMLALNAQWYKEAAARHFRLFERKNITWLIENWGTVYAADPAAVCTLTREADGRLTVFQLGAGLTSDLAVTFCERYARDGTRSANLYTLGQHVLQLGAQYINDGPADTKEIRAFKERLAISTLGFYTVLKMRKARK